MKHIVKQGEPQVFTDWKALSNEDWQPTYDDLAGVRVRLFSNMALVKPMVVVLSRYSTAMMMAWVG